MILRQSTSGWACRNSSDSLPATKVYEPWKLIPVEQSRFGVRLGMDYPNPVVDLFKSAAANEAIYNAAQGVQPRKAANKK